MRDEGHDHRDVFVTHAARSKPRGVQPLELGSTVAQRYLVRRVIGQGGMGQVVEAEHVALGRRFALKVLRLERWNDELVRRFNREARALARLTTPRVAQVTDFGVDETAGPFYVMELLEGETLESRLERDGCVSAREALAICAEICDALADVHAAGIVHRDLKPSNVGLTLSGPVGVKLLDFGLAAAMDDAFLSRITQSQQILGSLPYMAPEQFNMAEPAATMDVYAAGVVLFESLTGRMPFMGPSTAALIHLILSTPPPALPEHLAGMAPLGSVLERMLAKDPAARFPTATAAANALREVCDWLGGPIPRPAPLVEAPHVETRLASDPSARHRLPPTLEASAAKAPSAAPSQRVGMLPTLMADSHPPPQESGMRLSGSGPTEPSQPAYVLPRDPGEAPPTAPPPPHASAQPTPGHAPSGYAHAAPPQSGYAHVGHPPHPSQHAAGAHPLDPTHPLPEYPAGHGPGVGHGGDWHPARATPPAATPSGSPLAFRLAVASLLGVIFAGLSAIAVVAVLSVLSGGDERVGAPTRAEPEAPARAAAAVPDELSASEPTAEPPTAPEPPTAAAAPSVPDAPPAEPVEVRPEPARSAHPEPVAEPEEPRPAYAPRRAAPRGEPAYEPPPRYDEPRPLAPVVRPVAPRPRGQPGVGNDGVAREW